MKTLKDFYQAYAAWIEAGAPNGSPFSRSAGLCYNLQLFTEDYSALLYEMSSQFKSEGLDKHYPFNIGEEDYQYSSKKRNQYLNSRRIEWVMNHK
jgi:hypothetical protein